MLLRSYATLTRIITSLSKSGPCISERACLGEYSPALAALVFRTLVLAWINYIARADAIGLKSCSNANLCLRR